ncbi:hypothetical protein GCM10007981_04210 [Thermocladium modestius]|uniref:Major facilitator superfamily (MFS) profile domain-containing protein n=1 Tax=Thermocladium modestius TaxID=62609 RepID=A0A830GSE3_9CREN|nr:hypothetical protein GCM10007981_04210 [Thermocladium modestius]
MSVYLGLTSAPFLGRAMMQFLGWRYVLLMSAALAVLGLGVSLESMRELDLGRRGEAMAAAGAVTFGSALLSAVAYMVMSAVYGWSRFIYLPAISIAMLAAFAVVETRTEFPMLDLNLFRRNAQFGVYGEGGELWHRDVAALYSLRKGAEDVSPVPLGSKESHDPPIIKFGRWLRAKSLHSIMIEYKKSEMKA